MSASGSRHIVGLFSAALLFATGIFAFAVPAKADEATAAAAARAPQARRAATSIGTSVMPSVPNGAAAPGRGAGFANGFLYAPGPQSVVNVGGRLKVGKTGVYVPYYGNVNADPSHPSWQGAMGLAYGFRTWDISVVNGGGSPQSALPGIDTPKVNPNLSLSIRF
jgi:hypothetical protein